MRLYDHAPRICAAQSSHIQGGDDRMRRWIVPRRWTRMPFADGAAPFVDCAWRRPNASGHIAAHAQTGTSTMRFFVWGVLGPFSDCPALRTASDPCARFAPLLRPSQRLTGTRLAAPHKHDLAPSRGPGLDS